MGGPILNRAADGGLLYDADSNQFVWCPVVNYSAPEEVVRLSDDARWKVGKKMMYMQAIEKSNRIYALFEDPDAADVAWEYDMEIETKFDPAAMSFLTSPTIRNVRKLEGASHLRQAELIAYHMTGGGLYYVDDQTLYTYYGDEKALKNFDDEITVLHTQYVLSGETQNKEYLLLATYRENPDVDESKWGDLYFFSVDKLNPTNLTQRNKVAGVGKVVDIDYQLK